MEKKYKKLLNSTILIQYETRKLLLRRNPLFLKQNLQGSVILKLVRRKGKTTKTKKQPETISTYNLRSRSSCTVAKKIFGVSKIKKPKKVNLRKRKTYKEISIIAETLYIEDEPILTRERLVNESEFPTTLPGSANSIVIFLFKNRIPCTIYAVSGQMMLSKKSNFMK
jgi:hypothetical protein